MPQHNYFKQSFQEILTKVEFADAQMIQIQLLQIQKLEKKINELIEHATVDYKRAEFEKTKQQQFSHHGHLLKLHRLEWQQLPDSLILILFLYVV